MKTNLLLPFIVLFIFTGCNDSGTNVNPHEQSSPLLSYVDYGCQRGAAKVMSKTQASQLFDWSYRHGVLDLDFRFSTICEAIFEDSSSIHGDTIELFISNEQDHLVRCVCEYTNAFSLSIPEPGNKHIVLYYKYLVHPEYYAMVDTVITIH